MRIKFSVLTAVSSLSLAALATPAFAGGCMNGASNCDVGVKVMPSTPAQFGPMTVQTNHPMGYLRQVDFQRAPNVSITRVHGMMPTAGLSDAPSGFTGGCHPTSTQYCRANIGTPVDVEITPASVVAAPYVPAPAAPQPLRTIVGQGYDPAKFNGGMTPAYGQTQPLGSFGYSAPVQRSVTLPGTMAPFGAGNVGFAAPVQRVVTLPGTMAPSFGTGSAAYTAPVRGPVIAPSYGAQATAPVLTQNGTYASNVGADGTYWEKTSGPTMFGSTMATQVICKRKLPTQVVNPVVNVPYAVPTPVPTCGPAPHAMHPGHNSRYGQTGSRWIK